MHSRWRHLRSPAPGGGLQKSSPERAPDLPARLPRPCSALLRLCFDLPRLCSDLPRPGSGGSSSVCSTDRPQLLRQVLHTTSLLHPREDLLRAGGALRAGSRRRLAGRKPQRRTEGWVGQRRLAGRKPRRRTEGWVGRGLWDGW
jgi:hypothetical protein